MPGSVVPLAMFVLKFRHFCLEIWILYYEKFGKLGKKLYSNFDHRMRNFHSERSSLNFEWYIRKLYPKFGKFIQKIRKSQQIEYPPRKFRGET